MNKRWTFLAFTILLIFTGLVFSCSKKSREDNVSSENSVNGSLDDQTSGKNEIPQNELDSIIDELSGDEEELPSQEELLAEEERIAEQIEDLEAGLADSKKPEEEEIQLKILTDKNEELKFMEYGEELLIPQKTVDGYIIVHSSKTSLERNFYDLGYKLSKKEIWDYKDYASAKLIKSYSYQYLGDSFTIIKIILETTEDQTVFEYRDDGLLIAVSKYIFQEEEKYLSSERRLIYNQDNKISQDEVKEYSYSEDYKKCLDVFIKKYLYQYNEEGIPPDFEYLENDVLKMKNKYSGEKGTYTSQVFFNDNISVKSYYKNNFRVQDIYYHNKKVMRVRNYEKDNNSEL
ncbi:MAG: hypothetical protein K6C97_07270 [Treponema sp.]|nr:hypothetical protein [Treponema sp.]